MLELLAAIGVIVVMAKIASADDQSPWIWGAVTFALLAACIVLIPLPFVRVGIAFALAFAGMIVFKSAYNR